MYAAFPAVPKIIFDLFYGADTNIRSDFVIIKDWWSKLVIQYLSRIGQL